jgi:hypothetical protein
MTPLAIGIIVLFVLCVWCLFRTRRESFRTKGKGGGKTKKTTKGGGKGKPIVTVSPVDGTLEIVEEETDDKGGKDKGKGKGKSGAIPPGLAKKGGGPPGLLNKAGASGGWDHGKGAYLRYRSAQLATQQTPPPIIYPRTNSPSMQPSTTDTPWLPATEEPTQFDWAYNQTDYVDEDIQWT